MAVYPLRPATHHRLGGPLPHQLANAPQVHPCSRLDGRFNILSMRSVYLSGFSYRFQQLSRTHGQVTYVLLTRSPLSLFGSKLPRNFVRLACIRHAASVHPEPGLVFKDRSQLLAVCSVILPSASLLCQQLFYLFSVFFFFSLPLLLSLKKSDQASLISLLFLFIYSSFLYGK